MTSPIVTCPGIMFYHTGTGVPEHPEEICICKGSEKVHLSMYGNGLPVWGEECGCGCHEDNLNNAYQAKCADCDGSGIVEGSVPLGEILEFLRARWGYVKLQVLFTSWANDISKGKPVNERILAAVTEVLSA